MKLFWVLAFLAPLTQLLAYGHSLIAPAIAVAAVALLLRSNGGPQAWISDRALLKQAPLSAVQRCFGPGGMAMLAGVLSVAVSVPLSPLGAVLWTPLLAACGVFGVRWLTRRGPEWRIGQHPIRAVRLALGVGLDGTAGRLLLLAAVATPVLAAAGGIPCGGIVSLSALVLLARPHLAAGAAGHAQLLVAEQPVRVRQSNGTSTSSNSGGGGGREQAGGPLRIEPADMLPTYKDIGGMDALKAEMLATVGEVLRSAGSPEAEKYRLSSGGILLFGPPGTGKSFLAKATAGELGIACAVLSVSDLSSQYVGEGPQKIRAVFDQASEYAAAHGGLLLLLDELDAVAEKRDGGGGSSEGPKIVAELLVQLEVARKIPALVVMATSNRPESLDPAVVRPGRFDRKIMVGLPDLVSRAAILRASLRGRPGAADVDRPAVAASTEGRSAADLASAVDRAAAVAYADGARRITTADVLAALNAGAGQDRPTVEGAGLDRLVLDSGLRDELAQVIGLLADPQRAAALGVRPPSGVLLYGPPGTGKTSIARALAAEAGCSFYAVAAGSLLSQWVGGGQKAVRELFERARANAPSIVFIDEIDAVGGERGGANGDGGAREQTLNQLLVEIDGFAGSQGVLTVAATNRRDILDSALVRGGRLERHILIGLPDGRGRLLLLEAQTGGMRLAPDVDLAVVASLTDGLAPADLDGLVRAAGMRALMRDGDEPAVTHADLTAAAAELTGADA